MAGSHRIELACSAGRETAGATLCLAVVLRHRRDGRRSLMKSDPGQPMTLGNVAKAKLRLIAWCRGCERWAECDVTWLARLRGPNTRPCRYGQYGPHQRPQYPQYPQ